ncbi:MAG: RluA family pseudouridine synthase [Candidatus Portnoybacteria bacterium]|nr:RluA family pseudouridine synthase [Candidatus Portnoybacteria bacterium]
MTRLGRIVNSSSANSQLNSGIKILFKKVRPILIITYMNIPVIYENKDIIVVNKPAGILVHPTSKKEKGTLIEIIRKKYPKAELSHRLDKDTSGLLIISKSQKAHSWLKCQFKNRKIKKEYIALVHGKLKEKKGIITKSIGKTRKRGGRQTIATIKKTREAITRYEVIEELNNYTLIKAKPETGRTHQIRVHLASIGHPLAGDQKYKFKRQNQPKNLNRHFLHANYLKFSLPDGKIIELKSELPTKLKTLIQELKT